MLREMHAAIEDLQARVDRLEGAPGADEWRPWTDEEIAEGRARTAARREGKA